MSWSLVFIVFAIINVSSVFGAALPNGLVPISKEDGRIIGGKAITIDQAPYMAQIIFYGSVVCGGTIIGEDVILTAAHCINEFTIKLTKVRTGSSFRTSGPLYRIRKMVAHEDFKNVATGNDVGLIWLESPMAFSTTVQKMLLARPGSYVQPGTTAFTAGWGYMNLRGYRANQLMAVEVPILDHDLCNDWFMEWDVPIVESMICAGFMQGGKDACNGDSGGPLVINSRVVGITSFSILCAQPKLPGVYTNVAHFLDWIDDKLAENLSIRYT